jgi:hypothetical protein
MELNRCHVDAAGAGHQCRHAARAAWRPGGGRQGGAARGAPRPDPPDGVAARQADTRLRCGLVWLIQPHTFSHGSSTWHIK